MYDRLEERWRKQLWRQRRREAGLSVRPDSPTPKRPYKPRQPKRELPFIGADGEGCGRNRNGQQHYMLFRIGDRELYTGKPLKMLGSDGLLEFICNSPPDNVAIKVGFAFNYDASQILRDLPAERLKNKSNTGVFNDKSFRGDGRWTWFGDYGINYLAGNHLEVCRVHRRVIPAATGPNGQVIPAHTSCHSIKGTQRTIYDTFAFFQKSFVRALDAFGIGAEHRAMLTRNKSARRNFRHITREIRRYCKTECELLAELMEAFRSICLDPAVAIRPKTWNGAGKLANKLHHEHKTLTQKQLADRVTDDIRQMASGAYYGGRFEVTRTGEIAGPIFAYDIASAYPAAMRGMPCLLHGDWEKVGMAWLCDAPADALFVAKVHFTHPPGSFVCGLPVRQKRTGSICWPVEGVGTYWSPEIRSAERLGAVVSYQEGYRYIRKCDCKQFDWVEPLFIRRRELSAQFGKARAEPIKLALNALYGKLAQRVGAKTYANPIWASLITATVRARLNDAARLAGRDLIMFATDAVFSRKPLPLDVGVELGQWGMEQHDRLFVVQPGLYWTDRRQGKVKTRGISAAQFKPHMYRFERRWRAYLDRVAVRGWHEPPRVKLDMEIFVGLRLAAARGKPETACGWPTVEREYAYAWNGKRSAFRWTVEGGAPGGCIEHWPLAGGAGFVSAPHAGDLAATKAMDEARMLMEAMPDPGEVMQNIE